MKRKRMLLIISVAIAFAVVALVVFQLSGPSRYIKKQRSVFSDYTPTGCEEKKNSKYLARYDLSLTEWQTLKEKLKSYTVISTDGSYFSNDGACMMPHSESRFFTEEEISEMTDFYYDREHFGLPGLKNWAETAIIVCPKEEGISLYLGIYIYGINTK